MKHWNISLPRTPALALARQMLEGCLRTYDVPMEDAEDACHIIGAVVPDAALPPEGYRMRICTEGPLQSVEITGATDVSVLYGVSDFVNLVVPKAEQAHTWMKPYYFRNPFEEGFENMDCVHAPQVRRRGLWTWGYVIYDYRRYLANMARLKLNEIVIWNDYAPLNAAEVVACAHDLGIRVIWGYAWGWDTKIDVHLSDETLLARLADEAVERFEREYAALPGDGIYFQSFTETTEQELDGRSIADVVVPWVNGICARILEKRPNLELQFGLHATSVAQKLDRIAQIDPRVRIVWEDCGAFPYAYLAENVAHARETEDFTRKFSHLREHGATGVVTKGMICLDWTDFVHRAGPERIGECSAGEIAARLPIARRVMRLTQSYWMQNGAHLQSIVNLLLQGDPECQILALMEDGLFETSIWLPTALFAATLWDSRTPFPQLLTETAQRSDVVFANAPQADTV